MDERCTGDGVLDLLFNRRTTRLAAVPACSLSGFLAMVYEVVFKEVRSKNSVATLISHLFLFFFYFIELFHQPLYRIYNASSVSIAYTIKTIFDAIRILLPLAIIFSTHVSFYL